MEQLYLQIFDASLWLHVELLSAVCEQLLLVLNGHQTLVGWNNFGSLFKRIITK